MRIQCMNTINGFVPYGDDNYDKKKRLKIGEVYNVDVKLYRNYEFHKKYFALINLAWEYMTEEQCKFFNNSVDSFRKTMEIAAGWFEPIYNVAKQEWLQAPKSIAFDKMSEEEFEQLYERVKDVLFQMPLKNINVEEFYSNLMYF